MLETGPIERFGSAGNYVSYCRAVQAEKLSNQRKKGENKRKAFCPDRKSVGVEDGLEVKTSGVPVRWFVPRFESGTVRMYFWPRASGEGPAKKQSARIVAGLNPDG